MPTHLLPRSLIEGECAFMVLENTTLGEASSEAAHGCGCVALFPFRKLLGTRRDRVDAPRTRLVLNARRRLHSTVAEYSRSF